MKARVLIILVSLLIIVGSLPGQQIDSSIHVKSFPGSNVGAMTANAMASCPAAPTPCVLVLDPSLNGYAAGTMPALCANCSLADWRSGTLAQNPSGLGSPTVISNPIIGIAGDSLSLDGQGMGPGFSISYWLQQLLAPGQTVVNLAWSGYTSQNNCVILGSCPTATVGGGTIAACTLAAAQNGTCTAVTVTLTPQPIQPFGGSANYIYGTLAGVQGYYSYSGSVYQFTPVQVTAGTTFAAGAAFTVGQVDAYGNWTFPEQRAYKGYYIFASWGRNDIYSCAATQASDAALAADPNFSGYMFRAIDNANTPNEWAGTSNYNSIVACNATRQAAWAPSGHFEQDAQGYDSREHAIKVAATYLGNLPSGVTDPITAADVAHDVIPTYMHSVYADVTVNTIVNPGDSSVVLNLYAGSLSAEGNMVLVLDTGSNVEAMMLGSCTGTGPYTCAVTRGSGWGGTVGTHAVSAQGTVYSELHKNGSQFVKIPWNGAMAAGGYYTDAQLKADSYSPPTTTQSRLMTQADIQQMVRSALRPPASRYSSLSQRTIYAADAFYAVGDPRFSTYFEQVADGYGSWDTPNNIIPKCCGHPNLGNATGNYWNAVFVAAVGFANVNNGYVNYVNTVAPSSSDAAERMPAITDAMNTIAVAGGAQSASWNNSGATIAAGACVNGPTVAVTGSTTIEAVAVAPDAEPGLAFSWTGRVSSAGTVQVRVCNVSSSAATPTTAHYNVKVLHT